LLWLRSWRIWFRSVVFPAPKNPDKIVTGTVGEGEAEREKEEEEKGQEKREGETREEEQEREEEGQERREEEQRREEEEREERRLLKTPNILSPFFCVFVC